LLESAFTKTAKSLGLSDRKVGRPQCAEGEPGSATLGLP